MIDLGRLRHTETAALLMLLMVFQISSYTLWSIYAKSHPIFHQFVDAYVVDAIFWPAIFSVSVGLLWASLCWSHRTSLRWKNILVHTALAIFVLVMLGAGFVSGLFAMSLGAILASSPFLGIILLPARMVLITVGFAAVVIAILGVLTIQGILPYAPLFIEQPISQSPAYASFYFLTQVYFVMPFLMVSIAVSLLFLQQSRQREAQILHLSQTDPLTQLYNRRAAQERLAELMQNPAGYPISVILLDLDFFKKINDNHGHLVGDRVLKKVSQVLRDSMRKNDLIARFGGEEFLLILDGITCHTAEKVAERCRVLLLDTAVLNDAGERIVLTGSFGVACILTGGQFVLDDILRQADEALYQAKENGRNQVVTHACPNQCLGVTDPQACQLGEQVAAEARLTKKQKKPVI